MAQRTAIALSAWRWAEKAVNSTGNGLMAWPKLVMALVAPSTNRAAPAKVLMDAEVRVPTTAAPPGPVLGPVEAERPILPNGEPVTAPAATTRPVLAGSFTASPAPKLSVTVPVALLLVVTDEVSVNERKRDTRSSGSVPGRPGPKVWPGSPSSCSAV